MQRKMTSSAPVIRVYSPEVVDRAQTALALARRAPSHHFRLALALVPFVCLAVLAVVMTARNGHAAGDALRLDMTCDTAVLARGTAIVITGTVTNVSTHPVIFWAQPSLYATGHVHLTTREGNTLGVLPLLNGTPGPTTSSEFLTLPPGGKWSMAFRGRLVEVTVEDGTTWRHPRVTGWLLDFENSAILIPGPGSYTMTLDFQSGEKVTRDEAAQFGIQDVWFGHLISSPAQIEVK